MSWRGLVMQCINASLTLVIINLGKSLSPVWYWTMTWTNADMSSFQPLGTNLWVFWIKIQNFYLKKLHLKIKSWKRQPFCWLIMKTSGPLATNFSESKFKTFLSRNCTWKCFLQNIGHFVPTSMCNPHASLFISGENQCKFQQLRDADKNFHWLKHKHPNLFPQILQKCNKQG